MERWARGRYEGRVHFLCVGCAGSQLAREMGSHAQLKSAVNGYIAQQENMPRWGQLGCNGFIVLDSKQQVVVPQTAAFLEVRSRAFRDVEQHLDKLLGDEATQSASGEQSEEQPLPCMEGAGS